MIIITLSQGKRKARKLHEDSSWLYIKEGFLCNRPLIKTGLSISEFRIIIDLINNNGKIQIGQQYNWQNNIFDGRIYTWKSLHDVEKICWKHDIYHLDDWS